MTSSALEARRDALGLHLNEVAALAGISARTVYRLEGQGRLPRSLGTRRSYAQALELTVDQLTALVDRERAKRVVGAGSRRRGACRKSAKAVRS
jgi:transcriptional regulator with XRE-family HTH domain